MTRWPAAQAWTITVVLAAATGVAFLVLLATGVPPVVVLTAAVFLGYLAVLSWRSGGRFEFDARHARAYTDRDPPVIGDALVAVCLRADVPPPRLLLSDMDVPGAIVGYDDGDPVLAVDPRLSRVLDDDALEAILAHEIGHLQVDIHTDAIRAYLPQTMGVSVCWVAVRAGFGPVEAAIACGAYVVLAPLSDRRAVLTRFVLSLGVEAVALAASRYANRLEEHRADVYAATLTTPETVTTALFEIAAVATGDNDEDVAGPIPWSADRSPYERLFATHPAVETRAALLGCAVPPGASRYRPDEKS